jgi:hypothetical protein
MLIKAERRIPTHMNEGTNFWYRQLAPRLLMLFRRVLRSPTPGCANGAVVVGIARDTDLGPGYESILDGLSVAFDRLVTGPPESMQSQAPGQLRDGTRGRWARVRFRHAPALRRSPQETRAWLLGRREFRTLTGGAMVHPPGLGAS